MVEQQHRDAAVGQAVAVVEAAPMAMLPTQQALAAAHQHPPLRVEQQLRLPDDLAQGRAAGRMLRDETLGRGRQLHQVMVAAQPQRAVAVVHDAAPAVGRQALRLAVHRHRAVGGDPAQLLVAAQPQIVGFALRFADLAQLRQPRQRRRVEQRLQPPALSGAGHGAQRLRAVEQHHAPARVGQAQLVPVQRAGFLRRQSPQLRAVVDVDRIEGGHP
ncbi:hypothetical protein ATB54_11690 [Xanthomonas translucens]|nr:hypothetical protein ATB54_11690 [Xanthomonas translucens]